MVNDGSTDDTNEAFDRLGAKFPNLVILLNAQNKGYGAAGKTLLNFAVEKVVRRGSRGRESLLSKHNGCSVMGRKDKRFLSY